MTSPFPATCQAVVQHSQGDFDVLQIEEVPVHRPGPDQILMKVEYTGVNFIDLYNRNGIYPHPTPLTIGNEPAGRIVAIGSNVQHLAIGDCAVTFGSLGGYSEYCMAPANMTAKLPAHISTKSAASCFLQGITALTNVLEAYEVKKGDYILVHAAAGGVGALITQLASRLGAIVIGTTSNETKANVARKAGARHVVLYGNKPMEDVVKEVKALTPDGEGVQAVYDGVGKDTFDSDFEVVRRKGTLVILGAASGPVPPFPPLKLMPKSQKLIRPGCPAYLATLPEFLSYANKLFEIIEIGALKISLWNEDGYPFTSDGVQQAHKDLAGRGTTGKLIIKVA